MDEERLHPRLVEVLRGQGWTGLTDAQEHALPPLLAGRHAVLVAPTGYGKTEAALLPVISRMLEARDAYQQQDRPWPKGFKAIYITPLRALNRDLQGRLESWATALDLRIGVRHGDTTQAERARQSRNPPDMLITTPETVQLLLYGDTLRKHLRTVRFVIMDEVHDLCNTERGAQASVALERMEEVVAQPSDLAQLPGKERVCPDAPSASHQGGFQRIGLSATVADPQRVLEWLVGPGRTGDTIQVAGDKQRRLKVDLPEVDPAAEELAAELAIPPAVAAELEATRSLVLEHHRTLVFHNTRDGAELLASRSALLDAPDGPVLIEAHHGSLSAEHRRDVEVRFKQGNIRCVAATSSLELGIDVGDIDHVIQVHSPRSVARLLQRLGRAGHRVGAVSEGTLLAAGAEDALECIAVANRAIEGRLEPLEIRESPLVVLANQIVALCNEYAQLNKSWCRSILQRSGAFAQLDDGLFEATWEALLDVRTLYADDETGKLQRSGRARNHFITHIGLIPDEKSYRVLDAATKRSIGAVDDAFVAASLHPGASFIMGGRSWDVVEVDSEHALVRVAPARHLGAVPDWTGSQLPVSFAVAREAARLRATLLDSPDALACSVAPHALAEAIAPLRAQQAAGLALPTDRVVTVEHGGREVVVNVALGSRGNETLGRITQGLLAQRLGVSIGMQSDAYRLQLRFPDRMEELRLEELWMDLDADNLDLLMAALLRDAPSLRHHVVHVAKHFGALPRDLDPNRFSQAKLDALLGHVALHEESMARLVHDRLDLEAVAWFVRGLQTNEVDVIHQAMGPMSRLGQDAARRMIQATNDERLLAQVRKRVEDSDVMLVCTQCRNHWQSQVHMLPRRLHCRRCSSNQVACLRPWHADQLHVLDKGSLTADERKQRDGFIRNGQLVASFGPVACRALVGRGIGPSVAARIIQKTADMESPLFWREILQAELDFARTSAYWRT